ncbi:DUF7524 family protein [Halorussus amylolyticus]|uniref:DUF7524 family protein n=1 Tax=Halorussus amylolyticus TaxID=1126242 RepID=UPI00104ADE7F|nr:hypothetical protein [Halorussus amylolyticus]
MPNSLSVQLNRDRLHDIRTVARFEVTESFAVLLENGDAPVHVHLHLDDELSRVASIPANNHYVDAGTTRQVNVEIADGPRPVEGRLKIVTGHGAETAYVVVSVVEPEEREDAVAVDERLARPQRDPDDDAEFELPGLRLGENAPVVALGLLALGVAISTAVLADSAVVLFGVLAVVGSVAAAGYLLVR